MKQIFTTPSGRKFAARLCILVIPALIIFYSSCNKVQDDFDFNKLVKPTWNPEFAIPLVNSTLYLSDFLEDSSNTSIVTNPDKSLSFVFDSDSLISADAGDFVNFPDQSFTFGNEFNVPVIPPGFFDTIGFDYQYQFIPDTSDQRIDSIFLDSGFLKLHGETNLNRDDVQMIITIPDIRNINTREPLVMIADLSNPGGQQDQITFDINVDLSQYKIGLNRVSDTTLNTIDYLMEIVIKGDGNPDLSPYQFNLTGELYDMEFGSTFGYFGRYRLEFNNAFDIGVFQDAIDGSVNIGEHAVKLSFDIHNGIGAPISFVADDLYVTSDVTPPYHVDIELFGPGVPNVFTINSPDISQMGHSVASHLTFSEANFYEAFNIAPQELIYKVAAVTNYGADSSAQNFLLRNSHVSLDVALEFQLFGSIASLSVEDTVRLNFNENPKEIEYLLMRMNLTNGFPIDARAQVYFTDDNYQVIDSLITYDDYILPGATVGGPPEYKVVEPANKITDVVIDKPRLNNIIDADFMILRTKLSTTDENPVKIYEDYNIIFKLGTITGLTVDTNN